jgi:CHAT domain-containing protein/Tfp pilus assembly protein PilF
MLGIALAVGSAHAQAQPKASQAELDAAFKKGLALHNAGKFAEAVLFLDKAVTLAPDVFGPDHLNTAAILYTAGRVYVSAGRPREAETLFRRSLQIREARLGKDHVTVASTLNSLALNCSRQFRQEEAEALLRRCVAIRELHLSRDDPVLGETYNNLAIVIYELGRYKDAEPFFRRALALQEPQQAKNPLPLANTLNSFALCCERQGKLDDAAAYALRSLKLREANLGKDAMAVAQSLNVLGTIYQSQNRYREAEALLRRSLEIRETKLGKDHADVAWVLNNLAILYATLERRDEAEQLYRRALSIREAKLGKDHPEVATVLDNLSTNLSDLGRLQEAEQLCQRALKIREARLGKDHPQVLQTLNNMAMLQADLNRPQEAEALFKRCIAGAQAGGGANDLQLASFLNNLASHYARTDREREAVPLFLHALQIWQQRLGKDHLQTAAALNNAGRLLGHLGRKREAETLLLRALAVVEARLGKDHPNVAVTLQNLAVLNQGLGRSRQALELMQRGLRIDRANLSNVLAFSSESAMHSYLQMGYGRLPMLVGLAAAAPPEADGATVGLTWVLRMKGIVLETLCRYRQAERQLDALAGRLSRYRSLKLMLANAAVAPPGGLSTEEVQPQMQAWQKEADGLEAELKRGLTRAPSAANDDWAAVDVAAVRRKVPAGAALVEFVHVGVYDFQRGGLMPAHYFAFVLTAGEGPPRLFDLGEAKAIDAGVEAVRKEFTDFQEKLRDCETPAEALALEKAQEKQFQKVSAALHERLLAPLSKALAGVKLLYLAPDGVLNRLPFEALADGQGKYLVETYRCAYLSSGRDLLRAAPPPAQGTVVFAGPDFKLPGAERAARATALLGGKEQVAVRGGGPELRSAGWKALPGAAAEAGDIQKALVESTYGPVKTFVGGDALEEVLKALPAPRVLHLATHGFSLDKEPEEAPDLDAQGAGAARGRLRRLDNPLLRSGVVLAGANAVGGKEAAGRAEDGWLTAEEIALLDLHGCELVVLSACQTGLGDVRSGEGVYGLRRAFLYAGARSLVTSLFEVPDRETRALMGRFYAGLAAGRTRLEALHGAQKEMLRQRRQEGGAAHPFFWASFVLVGDPG